MQLPTLPTTGRGYLLSGCGVVAQVGCNDFEYRKNKSPGFFVIFTDAKSAVLYVRPGFHKFLFYSEAVKGMLIVPISSPLASLKSSTAQKVLGCMYIAILTRLCSHWRLSGARWQGNWFWSRSSFLQIQYSSAMDTFSMQVLNGMANIACTTISP